MNSIKIRSPYDVRGSKARGFCVRCYGYAVDKDTGRCSIDIYEDVVNKMCSIRFNPCVSYTARKTNWLVQTSVRGQWFDALFNGRRLSWVEK